METLSNESTLTVYKCLDTDLSKSRPFWGQRLDKCYVCSLVSFLINPGETLKGSARILTEQGLSRIRSRSCSKILTISAFKILSRSVRILSRIFLKQLKILFWKNSNGSCQDSFRTFIRILARRRTRILSRMSEVSLTDPPQIWAPWSWQDVPLSRSGSCVEWREFPWTLSEDVLAQDPEDICDETVSNPSFLVTTPSRIDKDPELSWSFQVWLRILLVTRGKTFAISEAKMRLSDEFGILIPGSCHSVTPLIIRTWNKKIRRYRWEVEQFPVFPRVCILSYRTMLTGHVNDYKSQLVQFSVEK